MKKWIVVLISSMLLFSYALAEENNTTMQIILQPSITHAFTTAAVSEEDLTHILDAGLATTSEPNISWWNLAVVTNPAIMLEFSAGEMLMDIDKAKVKVERETAKLERMVNDGKTQEELDKQKAKLDKSEEELDLLFEEYETLLCTGKPSGFEYSFFAPAAIVIYSDEMNVPEYNFGCGLACQNMVIAASSLGYGTKVILPYLSSATHTSLLEKLGIDPTDQIVAVLLIGTPDMEVNDCFSVPDRSTIEERVTFVK
ncbi:MAG: nitroreductase family protein [Clostridiales bacterium]|nr:nitroreductase family protein [Clostridiales bacterium]